MRAARILLISLAIAGTFPSLSISGAAPIQALDSTCYDVTVDVPPYHPGATLCPPVVPSNSSSDAPA